MSQRAVEDATDVGGEAGDEEVARVNEASLEKDGMQAWILSPRILELTSQWGVSARVCQWRYALRRGGREKFFKPCNRTRERLRGAAAAHLTPARLKTNAGRRLIGNGTWLRKLQRWTERAPRRHRCRCIFAAVGARIEQFTCWNADSLNCGVRRGDDVESCTKPR